MILLDKPAGVTSCKALFPIRKIFHTRRVGHAGSLDLRASGLIVAAVGRATRLLSFVESGEKSYTFNAHFGYSTDTDEWDGELISQDPQEAPISAEEIQKVLPQFRGEIDQVPPDFSAVKIQGKRASDLALKGRSFELKSRKIFIRNLSLVGRASAPQNISGRIRSSFEFSCDCSKGTYIRSLVRDIARALGTCGVVSGIRRTRIGSLSVADAVLPSSLDENSLCTPQSLLPFPVVKLTPSELEFIRNGNSIAWNTPVAFSDGAPNVVLAEDESGTLQSACSYANGKLYAKFFLGSDN
ncbi:MAG: tRNA pseudouridine(55) synthase TruB [Fibrobacteraceae bacterium]|nr:tRNA pseudouridine(55) synthase TruB [Fibrobacteraceae bacterium]